MIFVSTKIYQEMNIWGRLSTPPETGLGRLAVGTLTTTSWAGAGAFLCQRHLVMQAVSCLLAQRYRAESVSSKELKFSPEQRSLNCSPENRSDMFRFSLISLCNTEWGTGGPGPGPVGTSTQSDVQIQGNISESLAVFLIWSGIWGSGWLQNPPGL